MQFGKKNEHTVTRVQNIHVIEKTWERKAEASPNVIVIIIGKELDYKKKKIKLLWRYKPYTGQPRQQF